jgi:hypothetical protein
MKQKFCFLFAALIATTFTAQAQQTLRYTPKKGAEYNFKSNMDIQQGMSAMGQEISFNMLMDMAMNMKVVEAGKKSNTFTLGFKDAEVTMQGMGTLGGQDTTLKIDAMDGISFSYTADERGKLLSLDKSALAANQDQALQQMGNNITQLTNTLIFEYPEKALKKGDTWTVTKTDTNSSDAGTIITSTTATYLYDGTADTLGVKCARIQTKSATTKMEGNVQQMGMNMAMEADGAVTGTSYIELASGIPVVTLANTQLDMRMAITGQENAIIPMQMDMKMAITRVK